MESARIGYTSLAVLIEGAEQQLVFQGYSVPVVRDDKYIWQRLLEYAKERGIQEYGIELARSFGCEIYHIDILSRPITGNRRAARALRVLDDYAQYGYIKRRVNVRMIQYPAEYENICNALIENARRNGLSVFTIRQLERITCDFTCFLRDNGVYEIRNARSKHVVEFLETYAGQARSSISKKLYLVRMLLRYALAEGHCDQTILAKFPILRQIPHAHIPSVWSREELGHMLRSVDRTTAMGKRDYAMLLLAVQLGIRAGDIRNLKLEHLKWKENRIEFTQGKTGRALSLPLPEEVGWALIDYLKSGRPTSESKNVFIRHLAPFEPFGQFNNLASVLRKYIQASGIQPKPFQRSGMHTLRHSLASAMLIENVAMPVISEVLGHKNINTTNIYLRIDVERLRRCALEVLV